MSDDWAKQYIDIHKQKQQKKRDTQERERLARAGAPAMFQRIKDRIRQDLQTFYNVGVLQSLQFNDVSTERFAVNDMTPTPLSNRPTLAVDLNSILVTYHYILPPKGSKKSHEGSKGALRICSAMDGTTQVYRNGSEEAFADESDVSEFLLKPLLDFVDD